MKKNYYICLSLLTCLMAFLLCMSGVRRKGEALAERIAPKILRFHVLANSDSADDQAIKLLVRDMLLDEMHKKFDTASPEDSDKNTEGPATASRDDICNYIMDNRTFLEQKTDLFLREHKFPYRSRICLEHCFFPERRYGDMVFPAGTYDAVRVLLGKGTGKNFWCVLYPSLCYSGSIRSAAPDSSHEQLKALIPEEDFRALLAKRRLYDRNSREDKKTEQEACLPRLKIRLKFADLLSGIL